VIILVRTGAHLRGKLYCNVIAGGFLIMLELKDKDALIEMIRSVFGEAIYPGDAFLQGSFDGDEPYEEISAFIGIQHWQEPSAAFLDAHYSALSFFSMAGLRFYLPAYLVADVKDELQTANPLFILTHGFSELVVEETIQGCTFQMIFGRSEFINPRRYGAASFYDYNRYRLSVFTREEAAAIVAYLQFKRQVVSVDFEKQAVQAALDAFWLERARSAPTAQDLSRHLKKQEEILAARRQNSDNP
jgi:hypothetical protein